MPSFNQMPDEPQPFGFKVSWLALKTSDPAAVLDALELGEGNAGQPQFRPGACLWKRSLGSSYRHQPAAGSWL